MTTVSEQRIERLLGAYSETEAAELRAMRENSQSLSGKEKSAQVAELLSMGGVASKQDLLKIEGANLGPKPILLRAVVEVLRAYAMDKDEQVLVSDEAYLQFVDNFLNVAPALAGERRSFSQVLHLAAYLYTDDYGTWFFETVEKLGERTRARLAEKRGDGLTQ